ncbi:MAG: hypothetical protein PHV32_16380 [Eubacteriales bacterium]|nr:hypothetical protein [Eubacteriales bacterium]
MARVGAILIIASMVVFLTVPSSLALIAGAIIIWIIIGCVNISILMPFVFSLNNTEKLHAVVGTNLLIFLISLFQNTNDGDNLYNHAEKKLNINSRTELMILFKVLSWIISCFIAYNAGLEFHGEIILV